MSWLFRKKQTEDHTRFCMDCFFNSLPDVLFIRIVERLYAGFGFTFDYVSCIFPGDHLDPNAPKFVGVKFSVRAKILKREGIVSQEEFHRTLSGACEQYAKRHPEHADRFQKLLIACMPTRSFQTSDFAGLLETGQPETIDAQAVNGLSMIVYRLPIPGDKKVSPRIMMPQTFAKVVYDPEIISDQTYLGWIIEAAEQAYPPPRELPPFWKGTASNGITFVGYTYNGKIQAGVAVW